MMWRLTETQRHQKATEAVFHATIYLRSALQLEDGGGLREPLQKLYQECTALRKTMEARQLLEKPIKSQVQE